MKNKTISKFDKYLAGEMEEPEKTAFESELKGSDELYAQFLDFKAMAGAMIELPRHEEAAKLAEKMKRDSDVHFAGQFKAYVAGTLTGLQRQDLEKKLEEDEWLAYKFEQFKAGRLASAAAATNEARIVRMRTPARYAIAASIALIIGFFAWYAVDQNRVDTAALYAEYDLEELYPRADLALVNEGTLHKGIIKSDDFAELKLKGLEAFENKDWDTSLGLLSQYMAQAEPSDEETHDEINLVNLFIGMARLEKGELPEAVAALKEADEGVKDLPNYSLIRELIRWHLARAYVKNGDVRKAKGVLKKLTDAEDELIKEQAQNLLNDLR